MITRSTRQMFRGIFIVALCTTLIACRGDDDPPDADAPAEQKSVTLTVDGRQRNWIVYLPAGHNNAGDMPVVLVMHGGSGTPEGMISLSGFKPIADREKFVLVYPAGIDKNWNDGRPTTPNQLGVDDVSFIDAVCDYMIANFPADGSRMYATGISNGGFMSARLGCALSDRIAAVAVVAATMEATTIAPACNPGRPVPVIFIHGTSDSFVPFTGGEMTASGTAGGTVLSHFQAVDKWVSVNNCSAVPDVSDVPDVASDGTTVKRRIYGGGTDGSEVVSYVVLGGGHTWPSGAQYLPEGIIGKTSKDLNASEVIWTFFKRFRRE